MMLRISKIENVTRIFLSIHKRKPIITILARDGNYFMITRELHTFLNKTYH